jgi:hypothetical protein
MNDELIEISCLEMEDKDFIFLKDASFSWYSSACFEDWDAIIKFKRPLMTLLIDVRVYILEDIGNKEIT